MIQTPPPLPVLQYQTPDRIQVSGKHSAARAGLLCLLLIGAGQMYNKQFAKGFAMLALAVLASIAVDYGSVFVLILSIADAFRIASRLRSGETVGKWQFF